MVQPIYTFIVATFALSVTSLALPAGCVVVLSVSLIVSANLMFRESYARYNSRELQERNNFWKDAGRIGRGALKVGETVAPLALMVREIPDFEARELGEWSILHECR